MSADKRSVSTDALATLGTIIDSKQKRDAIHLAVIPVIASERLAPGTDVVLDGEYAFADRKIPGRPAFGIVDPFLKKPVEGGQRFWLIIYPRVITSLRHVWTHPAIPDEAGTPRESPSATVDGIQVFDGDGQSPAEHVARADKESSEAWLRGFCENTPGAPSYETVLIAVQGGEIDPGSGYGPCTNDGEYLTIMGTDAHCDIPPEFWGHIENVTGLKKLPRASHFSCSC